MGKIRSVTVSLTEKLGSGQVRKIIKEFFPSGQIREPTRLEVTWQDEWNVTPHEIQIATKKMGNKNKAPGPDGLWKGLLYRTIDIISETWTKCFQECVRTRMFPTRWKVSRLVLLQKPSKPDEEASSYRPICLLNEGGKLFERLVVNRINNLESNEGLSPNQFGFRAKRSTINAIHKLQERHQC